MVCLEKSQSDLTTEKGTDKSQYSKKVKPYYETRIRSYDCIRVKFRESLDRLEDSGWYWGHLTQNGAVLLLKSSKVGTFLLRDSSDSRYLFSLSVRLDSNITNVRVLFHQGQFMFECFETETTREQPKFDCIVKLVCYYAAVSQKRDNRAVYARSDLGDNMLTLEKPLFCKVPTLQHLARRVINKTITQTQQMDLRLGATVENFMRKYPFSI